MHIDVLTYSGYNNDEELGAVGVGASVCHGKGVRSVMFQCGVELILKLLLPY